MFPSSLFFFFFFNDTATTEIYTLSLHDALPIYSPPHRRSGKGHPDRASARGCGRHIDRKSTRLNSSHANISYAVFCLKKKKSHAPTPTNPMLQCDIRGATVVHSAVLLRAMLKRR